jgi:hypothetical protein
MVGWLFFDAKNALNDSSLGKAKYLLYVKVPKIGFQQS